MNTSCVKILNFYISLLQTFLDYTPYSPRMFMRVILFYPLHASRTLWTMDSFEKGGMLQYCLGA